ncbi:hypothetical protein F5X98DRAFT_339658 [Xylaria grammica]|nr:hypothetical protein F5X98DRAFT_339658 [Xylaria grammica]
MAFPRRLGFLTNPNDLATIFLAITVCFLTVTIIPSSSVLYFIRADYSSNNGDGMTSTAWFSGLGYCKTDPDYGALTHARPNAECFGAIGYNVEIGLEQDGMLLVSVPHASTLSMFLTKGIFVLSMIAIALCMASIAAHQSIFRGPTAMKYLVSVGGSLLALLTSGVTFLFAHSLESYIASGIPTTDATFTTTYGPFVYAVLLALLFQVAGCTVGFYSCIGGKYRCEGNIRLGDEESSESGLNRGRSTNSHHSHLDEKCPI